ncbi:unnamed protein product [Rotaria sordida]|uniref:Uncharacterized protein n=1 Tax=Rotaria sordida TaxID=392033 RepID=A0A814SX35_9BILA|nr:unnamed protein product [Rotaria sordida]
MKQCWLLLLLASSIQASHFDGGTIRWTPVNRSATTTPIQVVITQTYTYTLSLVTCSVGSQIGSTTFGYNFNLWCTYNCGATSAGYVAPPVLGYCTGTSPGLNLAFSQRSDIVSLDANDYFTVSHSIPSTSTIGFYRPLSLSTGGTSTTSRWNITASIDVRVRPDNGLINTPPLAKVMSPQGIPFNISTQIVISTFDIDGDNVQCRWSNSSLECGDVCFPTAIPSSTILSSNCTLTITGNVVNSWYCASIQVEDFISTNSTAFAMSSVPVQFLIYVYAPQNCPIPSLSSPSTCVDVQVGVSYTVTLTAVNNCGSTSSISDIAVQAFSGIVTGSIIQLDPPNGTSYEMNITYTPLLSQLGLQILCATALDNSNIPSAQYCITYIVGDTSVPTCLGTTTTTSPMVSITTTQSSPSSTNNWPLIGAMLGLIGALALALCCFCCCYFYFLSPAAKRRRYREEQNRSIHNPQANDIFSVVRPPESSSAYNIDIKSAPSPAQSYRAKHQQTMPKSMLSINNMILPIRSIRSSLSEQGRNSMSQSHRHEQRTLTSNYERLQRSASISSNDCLTLRAPAQRPIRTAINVIPVRRLDHTAVSNKDENIVNRSAITNQSQLTSATNVSQTSKRNPLKSIRRINTVNVSRVRRISLKKPRY